MTFSVMITRTNNGWYLSKVGPVDILTRTRLGAIDAIINHLKGKHEQESR
jgi:hypothetical protein